MADDSHYVEVNSFEPHPSDEPEQHYANMAGNEYANLSVGKPPFDPQIPSTMPVATSDLSNHVASYHAENNKLFKCQYKVVWHYTVTAMVIACQEVDSVEEKPSTVGYSDDNKPFNRFKNIAPCMLSLLYVLLISYCSIAVDDDNRILLQPLDYEDCDNGYINASYIDVCKNDTLF